MSCAGPSRVSGSFHVHGERSVAIIRATSTRGSTRMRGGLRVDGGDHGNQVVSGEVTCDYHGTNWIPVLQSRIGRRSTSANDATLLQFLSWIAGVFPSVPPSFEREDLYVAPIDEFLCHPGTAPLVLSSAIEDDSLVLGVP